MPGGDGATSLDEVAAAFARACEQADIRYALVGGFAVVVWGHPRTTADIDVLIDFEQGDVPGLVDHLDAEGLSVESYDLRASLKDGSHVTVFTADPVLSIDLKPVQTPAERREIEMAVEIDLGGAHVRVASPEDTIVFKVLFGSPQDIQDARSIIARQIERLDRDALFDQARVQGNLDEVKALVEEVEAVLAEEQGEAGDPGG